VTYVIYDLETTGLTKGFDQIVQFAAIRTDAELNIIDQVQLRCRLLPHVVPSPEALWVTGTTIEELIDPLRPSHLEMVTHIKTILESWRPALFLGFNSISFDEEFLRQAFYQCLFDPYLTNKQNSARADVLSLCRMTASLRPAVLRPAQDGEGRRLFKLKALAEANGIAVPSAHEAIADVGTTLALCRHIQQYAADIWSQFVKFSKKSVVDTFVREEEAFLFSETVGNDHRVRILSRIGQHRDQAVRQYCLDLAFDLDELRRLDDEALAQICRSPKRPIVTVRVNAAPTLWALYEALPEHLAPFDETEILRKVSELRDDKALIERLCRAAQATELIYPRSPHVEEQIYGGDYMSDEDDALMRQFHQCGWPARVSLPGRFADKRFQRLAQRLIYFERPDLVPESQKVAIDREVERRLMHAVDPSIRWRSIPAALAELQALMQNNLSADARQGLAALELHLLARQTSFAHAPNAAAS
jgi:exodeoxyribonuclease-1